MFFRSKRGKPKERRLAARVEEPTLAVFYWTGGISNPCRVCNISRTGAYIETDQDWYVGTILHLVLEPRSPAGLDAGKVREYLSEHHGVEIGGGFAPFSPPKEANRTFGLWARIVRTDSRGMGMEFVLTDRREAAEFKRFLEAAIIGVDQRKASPTR
jgi:hypothetical protein